MDIYICAEVFRIGGDCDMVVSVGESGGSVRGFGTHCFRHWVYHYLSFASIVLYTTFLFAFDNAVDSLDDAFCGGEGIQRCIVDVDVFAEKDKRVQIVTWVLF